ITKLIMSEADSHKAVTRYRARLQNTYVDRLIASFQQKSGADDVRAAVLSTLKTLRTKTSAAASSAANSATRAHFAEINDRIQRALAIK
ncbi:MAG: hypothetical protein Q4A15_04030, partial [Prevotellaceae bacterium]|nr:hypothetical protein [Prevotellaceae bacterium]